MNASARNLRARILGVVSHITISGERGQLASWEEVAKTARAVPGYVASAPFVQGQGMITRGRTASGVLVRGILPDEEPKVAAIATRWWRAALRP